MLKAPSLSKALTASSLTLGEKLRLIIALSVPSMLAQVSQVLMFFIDASMVGHLGAEASASIGLIEPAGWLFGSLTGAAAMGFSVQVAHAVGARDFLRARHVISTGYRWCIGFVLIITALAAALSGPLPHWLGGNDDICADASAYFLIYACSAPVFMLENLSSNILKATGDMKRPSAIAIALCVCDVIFNYLFIYILGQGVRGAAYGTCAAFIVTTIPLMWFVRKKFKSYKYKSGSAVGTSPETGPVVQTAAKLSAPIALQYVLMNGAQLVSTAIVAPLGTIAIASHSFAITAESLCYMPGYGIGDAATTLIGQAYGARRRDLLKSFASLTMMLAMAVMAVMGLLMYVFAPEMIGVLSPVEVIRQLGASVLRIEAFAEPFFGAAIVGNCIFVAMGDTVKPAIMNLGTMWGIRLTLAYALSRTYGLRGVWIAMATELTIRGLLFIGRLLWKFRNKTRQ